MDLRDFETLTRLMPTVTGWSEKDVPLERRGVSATWLVKFLSDLQQESLRPHIEAAEEAAKAESTYRAAMYVDVPFQVVPPVPSPTLMNVHRFVEHFVKPITAASAAPLYAHIPPEHVGEPELFLSHAWNSLLVGHPDQPIGTIDALAQPLLARLPRYVWIDFVCYNQHRVETIAPDMERVIGEIGRLGFVATPVPLLNRSWCLWELLCSERVGTSPAIFIRAGFRNDKILSVNALFRSFGGLHASQSSSPSDRDDILRAFLDQFGTIEAADEHVETLIKEKLSVPMFELHGRDEDLQFRPYPWLYDEGTDEAGRARGIEKWKTFEPYFSPALRASVLIGSQDSAFDMLIDAGVQVPEQDRVRREYLSVPLIVREAFDVAELGDTARLTSLFDSGVDPEAELFGTGLMAAAAGAGQLEVVTLLAERGAAIDAVYSSGLSAIQRAARFGHVHVVDCLLASGADASRASSDEHRHTPLHEAALGGGTEVVARLLDAGVDVSPRACNESTPLHMAADQGHVGVVQLLLDAGADFEEVNADGWTALIWASSSGHAVIAKLLLDAGANVNVRATKLGASPLHIAAFKGHADVATVLLDTGHEVSPKAANDLTPLQYALNYGHVDVTKVLLDAGADMSGLTRWGDTALDRLESGTR